MFDQIINKKHFLATQNTNEWLGLKMHQNSAFIFIYTNSKLIIEELRRGQVLGCKCCTFICLVDLILKVPSTIFQLYRDGSEPVLS